MSGGPRYILIAEGAHVGGSLLGLQPDTAGVSVTALENWIPPVDTRWNRQFNSVTYNISVIGTTGTAPTSWSLGARFEQQLSHTQGFQAEFTTWAPIQNEQLAACVLEGVGWYGGGNSPPTSAAAFGVIASSTSQADDGSGVLPSGVTVLPAGSTSAVLNTARVTVSRTVINQLDGFRVRFQPVITGGDSTTLIVLTATATGHN